MKEFCVQTKKIELCPTYNIQHTREDENRYILAAAVMRRDWAEVSVLHFMKPDFQQAPNITETTSTEH